MPTFIPGKSFTLSGTNLNFVRGISFGERKVSSFSNLGSTGISGNVPAGAVDAELFVETTSSLFNLGVINQVLDSSSQLTVGPLRGFNLSGEAGDTIQLTGNNFYQVDGVKFGETSGEFYYISSELIEAIVPPNADYGGVSVFSSLRTGDGGDTSLASGITSNYFIPIPEVTGLSSDPSGDFRGVPNLLLESGASQSAPDYIRFKPLAEVSGVVNHVTTGSATTISGKNFGADILFATGGGYLVSIGGVTGTFGLTSDTTMTGEIPKDLNIYVSGGNIGAGVQPTISSGIISVFSNDYPESYGSDVYFTPSIGSPQVSSSSPPSGLGGASITIEGFNLYALTGVNVNMVGVTSAVSAEVVTVGANGRAITFDFPESAANNSDDAQLFDFKLSGAYGNVGVSEAFYALGKPTITSNEPETNVQPGSSGTLIG